MKGFAILRGGNKKALENVKFENRAGKKNPAPGFQFPVYFLLPEKTDKTRGGSGVRGGGGGTGLPADQFPVVPQFPFNKAFNFLLQPPRSFRAQDFVKAFAGINAEGIENYFNKALKNAAVDKIREQRRDKIPGYGGLKKTGKGPGEERIHGFRYGPRKAPAQIFLLEAFPQQFRGKQLPFHHRADAVRQFFPLPGQHSRRKGNPYAENAQFPKRPEEHPEGNDVCYKPDNRAHGRRNRKEKKGFHWVMDSAAVFA
jgi:hypothetical protein